MCQQIFTDLDNLSLVILEYLRLKTGVTVALDANQTKDLEVTRKARIKQKPHMNGDKRLNERMDKLMND